MTVDERLEFLLQSTESLHQTVHELSGTVHELSGSVHELKGSMQEMKGTVQQLIRVVEADGENIRALVRVAELHDRRFTAVENGRAAKEKSDG